MKSEKQVKTQYDGYKELLKYDKRVLAGIVLMQNGPLSKRLKAQLDVLQKHVVSTRLENRLARIKQASAALLSGEVEVRNPEATMEWLECKQKKIEEKLNKMSK